MTGATTGDCDGEYRIDDRSETQRDQYEYKHVTKNRVLKSSMVNNEWQITTIPQVAYNYHSTTGETSVVWKKMN